jgi:hypothetical protein
MCFDAYAFRPKTHRQPAIFCANLQLGDRRRQTALVFSPESWR